MSNVAFREYRWLARHLWRDANPIRRLRALRASVSDWRRFWSSYDRYVDLLVANRADRLSVRKSLLRTLFPCVHDATATHDIEPTYFYQDAWAFELIVKARPRQHVDIGSHHKFVALLSKVVPVTMVDIRPLSLPLNTLEFRAGSILALPYPDDSIPSVSSLCVVEHIGLGRYGDPLDPDGTDKALRELKRIVMPGGDLYLSIPLDDVNRTYFNAHRAFTEDHLLARFQPFEVVEKRYIFGTEFGHSIRPGFGTGCYHLRKPSV
jgi:SAM-dependent methyltransferase